jgi:glutamate racemase
MNKISIQEAKLQGSGEVSVAGWVRNRREHKGVVFVDLHDIDDLILGCTHYPLLRNEIQKVIGNDVSIIDSAHPTADSLKQILSDKSMLIRNGIPSYTLLFTDFSMHVKEFLKEYFAETQSNVSEIKLIE